MAIAIRVVFVEDSRTDVHLATISLCRGGFDPDVRVVEDEVSLVQLLRKWMPDLVVSDLSLPRFSGLEAFELVRRYAPDVPFIFRSGGARSRSMEDAIRRGAIGHVEKDDHQEFMSIVAAALSRRVASRSRDHGER